MYTKIDKHNKFIFKMLNNMDLRKKLESVQMSLFAERQSLPIYHKSVFF